MSYQMSPPPQKQAPAPASYQHPQQQQQYAYPPQQQGSPVNGSPYAAQPPAKRQRLSPDPRSPQAYQNGAYHAPPPNLPGASSYGNPYAASPAQQQSPYTPNNYAASPQSSFNTPQPYPHQQLPWQSQPSTPAPAVQQPQPQPRQSMNAGSPHPPSTSMPPPPRPNKDEKEEKVDVNDISDALFGTGVSLKDEENYLHNFYSNRHSANTSFGTQQTSFGSSTVNGDGSFGALNQSYGSSQNGAFAGTMGGDAASQDEVEREAVRKREAAARAKSERDQHHLNNPFLLGNVLRQRVDRLAKESGVSVDVQGTYVLQEPEARVITNSDSTRGIVKAGSKIEQHAPFADVLSLISLAAGERLRGLVDEAYALSRARRYGDHGRVPPDLADLATGDGESKSEELRPLAITGTEWDRLPDAPTPEQAAKPLPTVSFQSQINNHLIHLATLDKTAEEARLARRAARRQTAEANAEAAESAAVAAEAIAPTPAEATPPEPKVSKKKMAQQAKENKNATEAQSSATTNQTAAMMALGKKSKKYAWMSGGGASMPTNRFAKPAPASSSTTPGGGGSGSGTSTPNVKKEGGEGSRTPTSANGNGNGKAPATAAKEPGLHWGDFSELGPGGRGVQLRDWVLVLERDGREKRALERALNRLA